jgi:hypothetical protein
MSIGYLVKSFGMDPDKILSKETMMKPYRTIMDGRENEERMMILQKTIKNAIIDEIKSADDRTWSLVARRILGSRY